MKAKLLCAFIFIVSTCICWSQPPSHEVFSRCISDSVAMYMKNAPDTIVESTFYYQFESTAYVDWLNREVNVYIDISYKPNKQDSLFYWVDVKGVNLSFINFINGKVYSMIDFGEYKDGALSSYFYFVDGSCYEIKKIMSLIVDTIFEEEDKSLIKYIDSITYRTPIYPIIEYDSKTYKIVSEINKEDIPELLAVKNEFSEIIEQERLLVND